MDRVEGTSSAHVRIMIVRDNHEAGHMSQEIEEGVAECARRMAWKGEESLQNLSPSL